MKLYAYDPDHVAHGLKICKEYDDVPEGWEFTSNLEQAKEILVDKIYEEISMLEDQVYELCNLIESIEDTEKV